MKRKLLALLLSGLAILLLMGAGMDQTVLAAETAPDNIRTEEPAAPVEKPVDQIENLTDDELAESAPESELDHTLLIDGQPVSKAVSRTTVDGITYVSLKLMSRYLDAAAQVSWNNKSSTATVTTDHLTLTARIGDPYLIANGRYLYMPKSVLLSESWQTMVSLDAVVKAFDARLEENSETGVISITRGSGALESADTFYGEEDLFWLSRVIYAESGNQVLEGKMAVGIVVLNRRDDTSGIWPDTIKSVIAQRNQFSTYKNGRLSKRTPNAESIIAAKLVLDGGIVEKVKDAYFFDALLKNSWAARNKSVLAVIGGHRFYG